MQKENLLYNIQPTDRLVNVSEKLVNFAHSIPTYLND